MEEMDSLKEARQRQIAMVKASLFCYDFVIEQYFLTI